MKFTKVDWIVLIVPFVIVTILYFILPQQIPVHFGLSGDVRYGSKELIFILGIVPFLVYKKYQRRGKGQSNSRK